ncbi:MAG: hypothetical protein WC828_02595 [Thermoleophilia bacterium]|jgi:hypothetical protein
MRKNRKMTLVALLAAGMVMLAGAGYAYAQSSDNMSGTATTGQNGGSDQNAQNPGLKGRHLIGGEVVKFENNTITIKTLKGDEKTVKVDDQTKYRKDGKDATVDDIKAGEKIGVGLGKKPEEGQDPVAKVVMIGDPPKDGQGGPGGPLKGKKPVVGEVTALNGDTVTIKTAEGDVQVKLPAITAGQRLAVVQGEDGTVKAVMYNPPERPQGQQDQAPPAEGDNA